MKRTRQILGGNFMRKTELVGENRGITRGKIDRELRSNNSNKGESNA